MADDLSVLFRLRAEASGVKAGTAEARAAVNQLRQTLGPDLSRTVSVTNNAFNQLSQDLNSFVAQRLPLVGGAFSRITDGLRTLSETAGRSDQGLTRAANAIQKISTESGKSIPHVSNFLTKFVQLEGAAKRDAAAVEFFGATLATKLTPQLATASNELAAAAAAAEGTGAGFLAAAGPIGIAVAAILAVGAAGVIVAKQLFDLTRQVSEFQGKMFDLSQQTGVQVETLSTMEVGLRKVGGSLDSASSSLIIFQTLLDEAQDSTSKAGIRFRELGISTSDTEAAFRDALRALAGMPVGFQQTNTAAELFGRRGAKQILALLKETNGDLDALTEKLRETGALITGDMARAADEFNDELLLLEVQLRGLAGQLTKELLPVFLQLVRLTGDLVQATRPLIAVWNLIGGPASDKVISSLRGIGIAVAALTADYRRLAEAVKASREARDIPSQLPDEISGLTPVPLPGAPDAARLAAEQADAIVAHARRTADAQNQILDELFQKGRITREQQTNEIVKHTRAVEQAELKRIDTLITAREREYKEAEANTEAQRKLSDEIRKLQQEKLDTENSYEVQRRALRAKAAKENADSLRNQIQNETEILLAELDKQIQAASDPELIEQLEQAKIDARKEALEEQKRFGFLTLEEQQSLNDQILKLDQDKDALLQEQAIRRGQRLREIEVQNLEALLQVQRINAGATIATLEALADAGMKSYEQAAKEIAAIRLQIIDSEIEATRVQAESLGGVPAEEQARVRAELNNRIKILLAERVAIEQQSARDIDDAQRQDIENRRRYADQLRQIEQDIYDLEREAAKELISLMIVNFASRRDILRARLQLDIADEQARHRNALQGIAALRQENAESKRTQEEKLRVTEELNRLEEAEAERHRRAMEKIRAEQKRDEAEQGGAGGFLSGLESGQLDQLKEGVQSFADVATVAFSAVGAAINGLAQGIGSMVEQWVLLGGQADISMKKLLATVLAGVAAQAATLAVFHLALGIAALTPFGAIIYGSAAQHFKAAALFGSIAAVAAIGGRAVAGGAFQQSAGAGSGGSGSTGSTGRGGTQRPEEREPLRIDAARREIRHVIEVRPPAGWTAKELRREIDNNNPAVHEGIRRASGQRR